MPAIGSSLVNDQVLNNGDYLVSNNQLYSALMQPEGNFCIYRSPTPNAHQGFVWGSCQAAGYPPASGPFFAIMLANGDFRIFQGIRNGNHSLIFSTAEQMGYTPAPGTYAAVLHDNGNLTVGPVGGAPLFSTNTFGMPYFAPPATTPNANWMATVQQHIRNVPICNLPLPGSHDAGAYGPTITIADAPAPGSQTQGSDIAGQLAAGVRYFDFRVCVKDGVFFAVHGGATTKNNYTAIASKRQHALADGYGGFILEAIHDFCLAYPKELVILNFSHFVGSSTDRFNSDDERDFSALLFEIFEGMMPDLTVAGTGPTTTYGTLIDKRMRVIPIVDDGGDPHWGQYKATPQQIAQTEARLWRTRLCFLDRYSDVSTNLHLQGITHDLAAELKQTMDDQQTYLMPGGSGHRDPVKFWVTQGVQNYSPVSYNGNSQNYEVAKGIFNNRGLNDQFNSAFRMWNSGHTYGGGLAPGIFKLNVLLLDYAAEIGNFPATCIALCNQLPV